MGDQDGSTTDEALSALASAPPPSSSVWLDPEVLRRRSEARHHRRLTSTAVVAIVVAASIVGVSLTATPSSQPNTAGSRTGTRVENRAGAAIELTSLIRPAATTPSTASAAVVAGAEGSFSLRLLRQLVDASPNANHLVSPFSLAEALAMAAVGARGETAAQLETALGVASLSSTDQAQGWAGVDRELSQGAAQDRVAFDVANSLWVQNGFPVVPRFLTTLQSEFGAGVWLADFAHHPVAAVDSVNSWVNHATRGKIPTLLSPSEVAAVVAVILNAVYFKARWATPFLSTSQGTFEAPGANVRTRFIASEAETLAESTGPGLDAVQLPYWDGSQSGQPGRYAALLLMPTSGSLAQFVDGLSTTSLQSITSGLTTQNVAVTMPTLHLTSDLELNPTMRALGVQDAFGPGADFSGFSPVSTMISGIKQKSTLDVTKWGTVATAATAVLISTTSVESSISMTFDRPFVVLIRDTKTGAVLFASAVNDPSSTT